MVHPLVRIAAARPQMLAEHASAYAELIANEITTAGQQLKRQVVLELVGLNCFVVAAVLFGVAAMLWGSFPAGGLSAPWMLVMAPTAPLIFGSWALLRGKAIVPNDPFTKVRRQWAADAAMLSRAGVS